MKEKRYFYYLFAVCLWLLIIVGVGGFIVHQIHQKNQDLLRHKKSLEKHLAQVNQEQKRIREKLREKESSFERQVSSLQESLDQERRQNRERAAQNSELRDQVSSLNQELESLKERNKQQRELLEQRKQKVKEISGKNQALRKRLKELSRAKRQAEQKFQREKDRLVSDISSLKSELQRKIEEKSKLKQEVKESEADIGQLKQTNREKQVRIRSLQKEKSYLAQEVVASLQGNWQLKRDLRGDLDVLKRDLKEQKDEAEQRRDLLRQLREQNRHLRQKLEARQKTDRSRKIKKPLNLKSSSEKNNIITVETGDTIWDLWIEHYEFFPTWQEMIRVGENNDLEIKTREEWLIIYIFPGQKLDLSQN